MFNSKKRIKELMEAENTLFKANHELRLELMAEQEKNKKLETENSILRQNMRVLKQYENLFSYDGTPQMQNLEENNNA